MGGMIVEAIVFVLSIGWVIAVNKKSKKYKKSIEWNSKWNKVNDMMIIMSFLLFKVK